MKNVLVTGGKGQLALCIKDLAQKINGVTFFYADIEELDITSPLQVKDFFNANQITHCINCAAYTAVDAAESNEELARAINVMGVEFLAAACQAHNAVLVHVSTDFVFDGHHTKLYTEESEENPLGVYGSTKLEGERALSKTLQEHFIVRTSWLYSEYGNNFLKTMLKLGAERDELGVVCDQVGSPTYAGDLAKVLLRTILEEHAEYGTYHYSNEGVASWYDFAAAIFQESSYSVKLKPIKTEAYPTPAQRPRFSVMDKSKMKEQFELEIPYWRDSLKKCLKLLGK